MTTLYVTERAWRQIETAVRKNPQIETGGIMMGYPVSETDWVVTYASGPGPRALQARYSVVFDERYHSKVIRKYRRRSLGRWLYIGDWHSHTIKRLSPSRADKQTVLTKALMEKYGSPSPVMLIVGVGKHDRMQARGFILDGSLRQIQRIELAEKQGPPRLLQTTPSLYDSRK